MQQLQYILGGQFGIPRPGEGPPPPPPAVAAGSGSQRPGRRAPGAAAGHRHGVGQADEMPDLVDDASMTEVLDLSQSQSSGCAPKPFTGQQDTVTQSHVLGA